MKKVGRNVYGSGDTIVTKTSHFFSGSHVGGGGGGGLVRGTLRYYCKAAATNTNSNNCAGPVVGGEKVFFSFMASPLPQSAYMPNPGMSVCMH